jgi:hypothetical protein
MIFYFIKMNDLPREIIEIIMGYTYPLHAMMLKCTCKYLNTITPKYEGNRHKVGNVFKIKYPLTSRSAYKLSMYGHIELVEKCKHIGLCYDGAIRGCQIEIIKLFIDRVSRDIGFAFVRACIKNRIDLVELIMKIPRHKERINDMIFFMYKACEYGRSNFVDFLLRMDVGGCHETAMIIRRGLEGACRGGHKDLAYRMIKLGANNYSSSMVQACFGGNIELIERLIELGATSFNEGIVEACEGGHIDAVELMLENDADMFDEAFVRACASGNIDIVNLLLLYITPSQRIVNESLIEACRNGRVEVILILVKLGDYDLNPGLSTACESDQKSVVELLVSLGANNYNLGLTGACKYGKRDIARMMIELGADNFDEAANSACNMGNKKIARMLCDLGARITINPCWCGHNINTKN